MSLSVPDRTLREFNYTAIVRNLDTDVANCTLISTEWVYKQTNVRKTSYQLSGRVKIIRLRIDLSNPIRWEDFSSSNVADCSDQTFYEAVTVATGHVLRNKSEFRTNGYSLGNLLDSLPLAPGRRKSWLSSIWAHSFHSSETQALSQSEHLAADLVSERDVID